MDTSKPDFIFKFLYVDSDVNSRLTVQKCADQLGYRCFASSGASDAFEMAMAFNPHVIMVSAFLEKFDGFDIVKSLKSKNETQQIPVIMHTEYLREVDGTKAEESGCDLYCERPTTTNQLNQILNQFVEKAIKKFAST